MEEKIGQATLLYEEEYARLEQPCPEDQKILKLAEAGYDCRRGTEHSWPVLYHLSHLRANLTEWLPIGPEDTVLEFGSDSGQLTGGFLGKAKRVVCVDESVSRSRILAKRHASAANLTVHAGRPWDVLEGLKEKFDWIIAPGVIADAGKYFTGDEPRIPALQTLRRHLKADGHLVLAADNRFGLKYWAGAMEPHTGRYFDSLEGNGPAVSRSELEHILVRSGCWDANIYYPYPERWFPTSIYSDRWLPKKGELNQNLRNFEGERLVLFDEEKVYDRLIGEDRFPEFANTFLCVVGPELDELPVYVKYSNDRAERFMIRTDILHGPKGDVVRKVPASEAAKKHVRGMKYWEQELTKRYAHSRVSVNRCELNGDSAEFEFLHGETFEERLDGLRAAKDCAALASALLDYKKLVFDTLKPELTAFQKSEEFVRMFGNPGFTKAYTGTPVNNLDWIFGNLMETADSISVIDYEWTFAVQVPAEYLIWRALSLYLNSRTDLQGLGLMAQLGISPEEEQIFEEMEHHFQLWLLDGAATIGSHYLNTAGRTITLSQLTEQIKKNRMQVYTDTGGGFSEAESFWIDTEPDKQGVIRLELLLPAGTKAVRIDPAETPCLLKVRRLLGELSGTYGLEYIHNGRELEEQGILYTTSDPQVTVPSVVEGTGRIYAELAVQELCPDTAYACMNLLNRVRAAERIYQSGPFRLLKKLKRMLGK